MSATLDRHMDDERERYEEDLAWERWADLQAQADEARSAAEDEYRHDPDDTDRPGSDARTNAVRAGMPTTRWDVV